MEKSDFNLEMDFLVYSEIHKIISEVNDIYLGDNGSGITERIIRGNKNKPHIYVLDVSCGGIAIIVNDQNKVILIPLGHDDGNFFPDSYYYLSGTKVQMLHLISRALALLNQVEI